MGGYVIDRWTCSVCATIPESNHIGFGNYLRYYSDIQSTNMILVLMLLHLTGIQSSSTTNGNSLGRSIQSCLRPLANLPSIQVSDGLAGMAWSGGITFFILLCMEAITISIRRVRGVPEPDFQLILDQDIILDHEIGDEFAAKTKESNAMALVGVNSYREGETILPGVGELEAGTFVGRSSRRGASRSRTRRFV